MPKLHLTKSAIDELAPGPFETVYWDASLSGFGVKVTPQGRKVFIVLYRTKDGHSRLRKYTIGSYGQTTLAIARIAAQRVLADRNEVRILQGQNGIFARKSSQIPSRTWCASIVCAMLIPCDRPMKSTGLLTEN
jgi:Arm DNA-binding domain